MELLIIRQILIVVASLSAGYIDLKTGYIYDSITLPLIAAGLLLNLAEWNLEGIALAGIVFALGYCLYYFGKIGGGDVKLFAGIAMALPFYGGSIFVLNAAVFSAVSALIFLSVYYLAKYYRKGIDFNYNKSGIFRAGIFFGFLLVYFSLIYSTGLVAEKFIFILMAPLLFGTVFMAFEKGIRKEFFLKEVKTKDLEEDEIPAAEFMEGKEKEFFAKGFKGVIGEKEKAGLIESGIKSVHVYRELPRFGVFIFAGIVLALLFPEFGVAGMWFP